MKSSNQLLLLLFIVTFLAILGSSMILKAEFNKIDLNDPLRGYSQGALPAFRAVKVQGNFPGLVQLQRGDTYEIRMNDIAEGRTAWKLQGDTLVVTIQMMNPKENYPSYFYTFYDKTAGIYLTTPHLSALHTEQVTCRLSGWQEEQLDIKVSGSRRGVLLQGSEIGQLFTTISHGGLLLLEADNTIRKAAVAVRDSSTFTSEYDTMDSLDLQLDSTAFVKLPGSLFSKLVP